MHLDGSRSTFWIIFINLPINTVRPNFFLFACMPIWQFFRKGDAISKSLFILGSNNTLVGNSNDPPRKYCILGSHKRLIDQSRLVKTVRKWSKLVETGWKWSKVVILSKVWSFCNKPCNGLSPSKANETFIWTFRNLIFLLSDPSHYGPYSIFNASLIILNISSSNFSEGVPAGMI